MDIKQLNQTKLPIVKIGKKLDKYKGKVLFPEKLAEANSMLKRVGLPKSQ